MPNDKSSEALLAFLLLCLNAPTSVAETQQYVANEPDRVTDAIVLTRPDGSPIWVNPHAVAMVRGPLHGEPEGHTTLVFTSGAKQTVLETVEEIQRLMAEAVKRKEGN